MCIHVDDDDDADDGDDGDDDDDDGRGGGDVRGHNDPDELDDASLGGPGRPPSPRSHPGDHALGSHLPRCLPGPPPTGASKMQSL